MASRHILRELIADPGPLGLFAFGTVTVVAGSIKCGWYTTVTTGLYQIAFWYGGLGQVIAGLIDLLRGSGVTGSTFIAFGLHWMLQGMHLWNPVVDLYPDPEEYNKLQGFYYLCFTVIAIGTTVGIARVSYAHIVLLLLVDFIFFFDAIHSWKPTPGLNKTAGYLCIVAGALAFYIGLALQWEESTGIRLPLFRRKRRAVHDFEKDGGLGAKQDV